MKSRVQFKFPTPKAWGSNFPPPGKTLMIKFPPPWDGKDVKCPGAGGGGMLKLRFDRYITYKSLKRGPLAELSTPKDQKPGDFGRNWILGNIGALQKY